jgi:hypothetical protein
MTRCNSISMTKQIAVQSRVAEQPWNSWMRLRYAMSDYWTGEVRDIDDKISLAASYPPFGGVRYWFVCPRLNCRVRKLYLPLGGLRFWSRRAGHYVTATYGRGS